MEVKGMELGKDFYSIITKDVLTEISSAMASLYSELLFTDKKDAEELVIKMTEEAKKIVNCYMQEQLTTILNLIDLF